MKKLTRPMIKALAIASVRSRGTICPIPGVHAAAEQALLGAMHRRGLIEYDGSIPYITPAGRQAVLAAQNA